MGEESRQGEPRHPRGDVGLIFPIDTSMARSDDGRVKWTESTLAAGMDISDDGRIKWAVDSVGHPFMADGEVLVPVQWKPTVFDALNGLIKLDDVHKFKTTQEGKITVYWRPTIEPAANLVDIEPDLQVRIDNLADPHVPVTSSLRKRHRGGARMSVRSGPRSGEATTSPHSTAPTQAR